MLILGDWWSVIIIGDWWKGSEFLVIGELTNLILVIGESWGVYTPPPWLPWNSVKFHSISHYISTVFWKSMEMESEYSMEVAVESTEFHGYLRDGVVQQMHVSDVFWVTESKSILVFLYGISLRQNILLYYKERSGHKICCPSWSRYFFSNYMGAR